MPSASLLDAWIETMGPTLRTAHSRACHARVLQNAGAQTAIGETLRLPPPPSLLLLLRLRPRALLLMLMNPGSAPGTPRRFLEDAFPSDALPSLSEEDLSRPR